MEKLCSRCGIQYEPSGKSTRNASWCSACSAAYMREWAAKNPEKKRANMRRYTERHREKINEHHNAIYRALTPEQKKKRATQNRSSRLKREFGITLEDFDRMLCDQSGLCAICRKPGGKRLLAVDHDNTTGKVRELLCGNCNLALERLENVRGWTELALAYLKKHSAAVHL